MSANYGVNVTIGAEAARPITVDSTTPIAIVGYEEALETGMHFFTTTSNAQEALNEAYAKNPTAKKGSIYRALKAIADQAVETQIIFSVFDENGSENGGASGGSDNSGGDEPADPDPVEPTGPDYLAEGWTLKDGDELILALSGGNQSDTSAIMNFAITLADGSRYGSSAGGFETVTTGDENNWTCRCGAFTVKAENIDKTSMNSVCNLFMVSDTTHKGAWINSGEEAHIKLTFSSVSEDVKVKNIAFDGWGDFTIARTAAERIFYTKNIAVSLNGQELYAASDLTQETSVSIDFGA